MTVEESGPFPRYKGGGCYTLSDGSVERGQDAAFAAQAELDGVAGAGANRQAIERTLEELQAAGRLQPIDEAKIATVRSLADAVDTSPYNAQLWNQYRDAVEQLTEADDDVDSDLQDALEELRSRTPVGDTPAT